MKKIFGLLMGILILVTVIILGQISFAQTSLISNPFSGTIIIPPPTSVTTQNTQTTVIPQTIQTTNTSAVPPANTTNTTNTINTTNTTNTAGTLNVTTTGTTNTTDTINNTNTTNTTNTVNTTQNTSGGGPTVTGVQPAFTTVVPLVEQNNIATRTTTMQPVTASSSTAIFPLNTAPVNTETITATVTTPFNKPSLTETPILKTDTTKINNTAMPLTETLTSKINTTEINDTVIATTTVSIQTVANTFENIQATVEAPKQMEAFKAQGGDLLYKDSNSDGISDYDSIHVYGLDPVKPTITTVYEGKEITAGEKITLGFDPNKKDLVKVIPEEPKISQAKVVSVYKVEEVKLSTEKNLVITGRALPNSFVTIYIYSTPIIVTVKTDINGDWQYTLNKELENGKHEVYTATVNNTGKILAKSSAFTFVKTAEAATLETLPLAQNLAEDKPNILSSRYVYLIGGIFLAILVFVLFIIGFNSRKNNLPENMV